MVYSVLFILILAICILNMWVVLSTEDSIDSIDGIPAMHYALVLGAGLESGGQPSDILKDRVLTAVDLHEAGKAEFLILSGSAHPPSYNEPAAMEVFAILAGVPESNCILDDKGVSTFDSLINFHELFPTNPLIIVTQKFHLPRALWLSKSIGLKAKGVAANHYRFKWYKHSFWRIREFLAIASNGIKVLSHYLRKGFRAP